MLVAVIGGIIAGACLIFIAWAVCNESVTIPPKSLVRQWRQETAARGRSHR